MNTFPSRSALLAAVRTHGSLLRGDGEGSLWYLDGRRYRVSYTDASFYRVMYWINGHEVWVTKRYKAEIEITQDVTQETLLAFKE